MKSNKIKRIKIKNKNSFKLIERGTKWLEIRLVRGFFADITNGTVFELYNSNNSVKVIVENKQIFNSLEELLSNRIIRIGSTPHIKDENIDMYYRQFYSERALKKHKVMVLKINRLFKVDFYIKL